MHQLRFGHDSHWAILIVCDHQVRVDSQLMVDRLQNLVVVHGPIARNFSKTGRATEHVTARETAALLREQLPVSAMGRGSYRQSPIKSTRPDPTADYRTAPSPSPPSFFGETLKNLELIGAQMS